MWYKHVIYCTLLQYHGLLLLSGFQGRNSPSRQASHLSRQVLVTSYHQTWQALAQVGDGEMMKNGALTRSPCKSPWGDAVDIRWCCDFVITYEDSTFPVDLRDRARYSKKQIRSSQELQCISSHLAWFNHWFLQKARFIFFVMFTPLLCSIIVAAAAGVVVVVVLVVVVVVVVVVLLILGLVMATETTVPTTSLKHEKG